MSLATAADSTWTDRERRILTATALSAAPRVPDSPSNRYADNADAAGLGKALFFDRRFSDGERFACASCHLPGKYYTDGLPRSQGAGSAMRNAPTVVGAAFQRWFYWDGRRDSLWSQALIPFEAADEMGSSRTAVVQRVLGDKQYRRQYEAIFGTVDDALLAAELPAQAGPYGAPQTRDRWFRIPAALQQSVNQVYANLGKAIAAFERGLLPPRTRFDRYVAALDAGEKPGADARLDADEIAGAKMFMDASRTQCLQCHNGPMLTNNDFHNIGTGNFSGPNLDYGRVFGLRAVLMDEFNCLGPYSDAEPNQCASLRFLSRDAHVPLEGAFKVPGLRGLSLTAPYFHDGRFATLAAVLRYYNEPPATDEAGPHELRPLGLSATELQQLERFLLTLSADPRNAP